MDLFFSALAFGFLGGVHCLGMCGPIAFAVPVDRSNKIKGAFQNFMYQFGRVLTYTSMGAFFGAIGAGLTLAGFQQYLSIAMGSLMILAVLWPSKKLGSLKMDNYILGFVSRLKGKLGLLLKNKDSKTLLLIGILNGFLPCGLVYMALIGALATGTIFNGALYMLLFGLGTIPFMFAATFVGNFLSIEIRNKFQKAIPYFVVIIGLIFILRGLGLGIPLISPPDEKLQIPVQSDSIVSPKLEDAAKGCCGSE